MSRKRPAYPRMVPALQTILDSELARGNTIADVGEWPPTCRLIVILSRPFRKRYALAPDVTFEATNDRHYWKAEYAYLGGIECLACGF